MLLLATAADLQAMLANKTLTSRELVKQCLEQTARHNGYLKAVIALPPRELLYQNAELLDQERAAGKIRGPLHGIPILLKDNIATTPKLGLPTTCGSLALVGSKPRRNAAIVDRLVSAGAIILGKTNLSEWSYYRSDFATAVSGWSAVGGQTQSPYVRGGFQADDSAAAGHSNPGGSSSGSAVAVAAGFAPLAIGTDTMGSLMVPAERAALYAIKPTIKLVPQEGLIPVTPEADAAGPMAKSVLDLADLLDVLVDAGKTKVPEEGYRAAVTGSWGNIRIGVVEPEKWMFDEMVTKYEEAATEQMLRGYKAAYEKLGSVVQVVKPVELISPEEATDDGKNSIWTAVHSTFKPLLEKYLASIDDCEIRTLEDLIKFNNQHPEEELPACANNQGGLINALNASIPQEDYDRILTHARTTCGRNGIDKALDENEVDVLVGPGDGPMFNISAAAGYPSATLPLGYLNFNGRPFGLQVLAKAHQEALLVQVQSAWEATFPRRQPPPLDEINPEVS